MSEVVGRLSPREREILALVATGKGNKEIATELSLSPSTRRNVLSRGSSHSAPRAVGIAWVLVWAAVAVALAASPVVSGGGPTPALPVISPPPASAQAELADGTAARILSADTTASETTIVVQITGREQLGERLVFSGPAFLVDANGTRHMERGGSISGRILTLRFDGAGSMPEGATSLVLSGVGLTPETSTDPAPAQATYLKDATYPVIRSPQTIVRRVPAAAAAVELAHGTVSIDAVLVDDSVVVVQGHLAGFTREEIQATSLGRSVLLGVDGREVTLAGGRSGFGPNLELFELHFKQGSVAPGVAAIRLQLNVNVTPEQLRSFSAVATARLAELERSAGATATLPITWQ